MVKNKGIPRPEHPRPLLERADWFNLNGQWGFAFDDRDDGITGEWFQANKLKGTITVPFAYQTSLSGIDDQVIHEIVWYERSFTIPKGWKGKHILLHFGAVDYYSTVWINGQEAGYNQGGHVPFSLDITPYLVPGENRVSLRVRDPQDPEQPRGKQAISGVPGHVDYYCTTGIWQPVWLEAVPPIRIDDVRITPVVEDSAFSVVAILHAPAAPWRIEVEAIDEAGKAVCVDKESNKAVIRLSMKIPGAKLWSPDSPHLYNFTFRLYRGDSLQDEVRSYGGLRHIAIQGNELRLNDQPLYLAMVLDQGYWPGGGMTAPSDDDFRKDVEFTKLLGFNGSRKHQKAEDPRWLYWCDKLGLLVWGEMANAREWSPRAEEWLLSEWTRIVRRDYNHPCIVSWVPMNESWGVQEAQTSNPGQFAYLERIVTLTRQIDSSRPIIDNDGWEHTDITDICALHDYTGSAAELKRRYQNMLDFNDLPFTSWDGIRPIFARTSEYRGQPIILSEVGGYLMLPPQKTEKLDIMYSYYGTTTSAAEMLEKYRDLMQGLKALPFLSGFCYTQLTDIEHEQNGLLTFTRESKLPIEAVAALNKELVEAFTQSRAAGTHRTQG